MSTVVLITGASTGFGRAAAEMLGRRGYMVFATMRDISGQNSANREALESLAKSERLELQVLDLDVTREDSVEQAVQEALRIAGRIDVVINNAGVAALGVTEAFTIEQMQRLFDVNYFGVARVNRAVLPSMRKQQSGLLIHVSSAAGRIVVPAGAAYSGSKFAFEALADAYRFELSPFGIDSVLVEPGMHRTPILDKFLPPADVSRVKDYGTKAGYAAKVKAAFDAASVTPETPDSIPVVDAFIRLIETPFGERPFRTVPTAAVQPLLQPYNDAADQLRYAVAQMFNVTELLDPHRLAVTTG